MQIWFYFFKISRSGLNHFAGVILLDHLWSLTNIWVIHVHLQSFWFLLIGSPPRHDYFNLLFTLLWWDLNVAYHAIEQVLSLLLVFPGLWHCIQTFFADQTRLVWNLDRFLKEFFSWHQVLVLNRQHWWLWWKVEVLKIELTLSFIFLFLLNLTWLLGELVLKMPLELLLVRIFFPLLRIWLFLILHSFINYNILLIWSFSNCTFLQV